MRTRGLTTWAYTIGLLCVLAPAPSFTDSLGDAASAEERRRAARDATSSTTAKSSSRGSGKSAGVTVSEPSATTSTAGSGGSTREAASDSARSSKPTSPSGQDAAQVGRSGSGHGSGTAAGVAAPSVRRVYNNQALLELRDQSPSRGTFSQGTDGQSSSDPTSSTSGGASSSSSSQSSSTSSTPNAPSSPGPVAPREPTTSPTPAPSKPTATPAPAPTPTPAAPSRGDAVVAAIPELSRWKTQMLTYGQKACTAQASAAMTDDERLGSTYYDATRVYEQIADFTGQSGWEDCAEKAKAIYRGYVLRNQGKVPGYWNFTTGFRMDWDRNGDALSKQAGILLSQNAAFCTDATPLDWTAPTHASRETAYCILSYLNAEALGQPRRARLANLVDQALGHVDKWFVSKTSRAPSKFDLVPQAAGQYYVQPFMVGLTTQALIRYWDATHDPRVQPAVKVALDWLWTRAWVSADRAFWYENWAADPSKPFPSKPGAADLNLLIAPAFAWMFHQTGDDTYRDRGDQVFAGGVKGAWLDGPKQFNQNYMWSFDYVKWRSE